MEVTQLFDSRPTQADTRQLGYQDIKSRIHQDLLNRLNLERLAEGTPAGRGAGDPHAHRGDAGSRDDQHAAQSL